MVLDALFGVVLSNQTVVLCQQSGALLRAVQATWTHSASHHITPHHTASHHTTSHYITPHHITSHHTANTIPHHTSHNITSRHITDHTTSHHTTSHHSTLCSQHARQSCNSSHANTHTCTHLHSHPPTCPQWTTYVCTPHSLSPGEPFPPAALRAGRPAVLGH